MEVDSLAGLSAAFEEWRSKKRHPREAMPADLLARARRAARRHGPMAVSRVTKVDRSRLKAADGVGKTKRGRRAPGYSRLELATPAVAHPFAEVELPTGLKVRLFTQSSEALELLSSLCGAGVER